VDSGEASVNTGDDDEDNSAAENEGQQSGEEYLKSVSVEVSQFASTMGNQVRTRIIEGN
jgi:hypothetical protein